MEMLRKKKDNSEYEIDRELTGKFAIEKNAEYQEKIEKLEEENKKLKEFKEKWKESMFYFKAQMERAEPKTAREAEDLQRAKEIFEKLYREELSCLEEENKKLRGYVDNLDSENDNQAIEIEELKKEVKKWKMVADENGTHYDMLEEEYRKLKERAEKLEEERRRDGLLGQATMEEAYNRIAKLEEENKKLKEKIERLEFDVDAWHQLKLLLEGEIEKQNLHIEAKDKAYMNLLTDYNYLQARIKRMEKAFLEYVENHKKLEDELDDVIMNR